MNNNALKRAIIVLGVVCAMVCGGVRSIAQSAMVNLAPIDGMDITYDNVLGYQVQLLVDKSMTAVIKGTLRYRKSGHSISYTFRCILRPGVNTFRADEVHPVWQYSSSALKELFTEYKVLPQGTYEYCVSVLPGGGTGDGKPEDEVNECLYRQSEDLFMISLIEPENNAKIYEYNPMLSWVCTYPFANMLSYKVRVAEIKHGQNTSNAITRNNPIYEERDVMQTSIVYPVYAKPLVAFQPYAWTVDAYYRGILLGGAEPWKFTIIEDTTMVESPGHQSYYEFYKHNGETMLYAVGEVKLKYVTSDNKDTLSFEIFDSKDDKKVLSPKPQPVKYGDNIFAIDLRGKLKHQKRYELRISTLSGKMYTVPFLYYNPLFVKP